MSEVNTHAHDVPHEHEEGMTTKKIWRVFWWMLLITVFEVFWGMRVSHHFAAGYQWVNALVFLSMTLVKAALIVGEFMHLNYEVKNLIRTILVPLTLFIWFIVAFLADGDSWLNLRNRYAPHDREKAPTEVAKPAEAEPLK
ncbi:MAG TPA: cytochrome C oxidase subunit IV family protein [Dinghuibacter sp.]|jgi:cytochrome c oxidase subunit IV|uniref:cytochrome C oxidase subunit IV family protein n=1 Tax=Dinghuibacter sp. TaxID=2024697 RepID=UPI002BA91DD2|nr:cytochrome C oxidase subunit IV family protein [Dinghuibacter sp.]HTJ15025.1 cytochrome C oxidase subunit IV family protein [Dinghuibacter sp.]